MSRSSAMFITSALLATEPVSHGNGFQLTSAPQGHVLTNANVWSPDGQWIVYDVRTGDAFNCTKIEQVNVRTGVVQRLYESRYGANCGVVTYSPSDSRVVFILGPENPTSDWNYGFTHRRGVFVETDTPGLARPLDAMNYAPPFVAGALRGGSHVHVFSPDGRWVSFTYEDEVLARLDALAGAPPHEPNQRNIGVAVPAGPVQVARSHPRNHDGDWFSVLVTKTVADPKPGSDEISRAFEEGWVGRDGYVNSEGSKQRRALVFLGTVSTGASQTHAEVFIADLPEDLTKAGTAPLAGTETRRPAPPRGVSQRRLTFTSGAKYPGVVTTPRHWLRVSPDGSQIAFLMKDDAGVVQFWTVAPADGTCRQVTQNTTDISSAFTWSPDGRWLAHTLGGSVCVTEVRTGILHRLTTPKSGSAQPRPEAVVFSPDGRLIAYMQDTGVGAAATSQIFIVQAP